jgi:hypothetical protein
MADGQDVRHRRVALCDAGEEYVCHGGGVRLGIGAGIAVEIAQHRVDRALAGDGQVAGVDGAAEAALIPATLEGGGLQCVRLLVVLQPEARRAIRGTEVLHDLAHCPQFRAV